MDNAIANQAASDSLSRKEINKKSFWVGRHAQNSNQRDAQKGEKEKGGKRKEKEREGPNRNHVN